MKDKTSPKKKLPLAAKIITGAGIVLGAAALFATKFIFSVNTKPGSDDDKANEPSIDPDTYDHFEETELEDEVEYAPRTQKEYRGYIPSGCNACGGPYPLCKMGCSLYDDE